MDNSPKNDNSVIIYSPKPAWIYITFTFVHLAYAFIQSDLQMRNRTSDSSSFLSPAEHKIRCFV